MTKSSLSVNNISCGLLNSVWEVKEVQKRGGCLGPGPKKIKIINQKPDGVGLRSRPRGPEKTSLKYVMYCVVIL